MFECPNVEPQFPQWLQINGPSVSLSKCNGLGLFLLDLWPSHATLICVSITSLTAQSHTRDGLPRDKVIPAGSGLW